jgi:hypothetical protein
MLRRLIVTHHSPDLDAVGAVWVLKRFDAQHYADSKVGFVNPGETIALEAAEELGCQLHEVTHVDTGLGEFDHHQPDRGKQYLSATLLVYKYVCKIHPDLEHDYALKSLVEFVTEVDQLGEVHWPQADHLRYNFMIHELVKGMEFIDPHNDDSQMHFGLQCLDVSYANAVQHLRAVEIVEKEGKSFELSVGKAIGFETSNDDVIKLAQKRGFILVIRKDPKLGNIRIKVRPDAKFDLKRVAEKISQLDKKGSWYYHPSGKMLINGSRKHRNQAPSPLSLNQTIEAIESVLGT